jgi:hypothetical protein
MIKEAELQYLSEREQKKPVVRVSELIAHLQTLPQDYEIVLYPKYFDPTDKFDYARLVLKNIGLAESRDGHQYCRIIF